MDGRPPDKDGLAIAAAAMTSKARRRAFFGGKGHAAAWRRICALMPAHANYLEPFLGSGIILGMKRPAPGWEIGLDLDPAAVSAWNARHRPHWRAGPIVVAGDALRTLAEWKSLGFFDSTWFIYVDAPYPLSCRSGGRRRYAHEPAGNGLFANPARERAWHLNLLDLLSTCGARVMVSCYWNPLYFDYLQWQGFRAEGFRAGTRGGVAQEWLWMNYEPPPAVPLHDTRYVGRTFRERERIGRLKKRWVADFMKRPPPERQVILEALNEAGAKSCA